MRRFAGKVTLMIVVILGLAEILQAQQPGVHYWHQGAMPPGAIGSTQLARGGPVIGFFQPVEIKAPEGAMISPAVDGRFEPPKPGTLKAGMLIGSVYRLQISGIHLAAGLEVFPTVEIIDRTYAPVGMELRFPIPIEISQEELRLALDGKFVTKVIYLEDPLGALPAGENPLSQSWFDVKPGEDPLAIADFLGRPVAILRIGGRLPDSSQSPDATFLFGCPPLVRYPSQARQTAEKTDSRPLSENRNKSEVKILPPPPSGGTAPAVAANDYPIEPIIQQSEPLAKAAYPPWTPPGISQPWPKDEYLRDGGDHDMSAGPPGRSALAGVQMEDTVASYNSLDGRTLTTASNEIFIYSPRFAAVRKVAGLVAAEQRDRLSDVSVRTSLAEPKTVQKIGAAKQQVQLVNKTGARPAQAFRMKQGDGALSDVIGPRGFQNAYKPYENLAIIRTGVYKNGESIMLARGHQAAVAWTHDQSVQVIIDRRGPMAAAKYEQTESVYTADVPPGHPKLRIIKTASASDALPGEEVWFTIRFDNIGDQTIGNVVIIDSLTTRLEYVEQSAQCSREAKFSTMPNEGDSLVVRCELTNPLEPGRGGIVRFCCKVR
jgi:uncharacterized repeat protein (TIGR01451 family)